jgi:ADP-L-glycero-D-manno-heptose 6-epimerase
VLRSSDKPTQWVGLKFFNVYGPHEEHKRAMASYVFQSYNQICSSGRVRLFKSHRADYGDGEQLRDFIYIKDVIKVVLFFLQNRELSGIVNVGTGEARSYLDLVRSVFEYVGKDCAIDFIDIPEELKRRYQYFTQATVEKLRSLGYTEPFSSLEEGVKDYICGYLTNARRSL